MTYYVRKPPGILNDLQDYVNVSDTFRKAYYVKPRSHLWDIHQSFWIYSGLPVSKSENGIRIAQLEYESREGKWVESLIAES